MSLLDSLTELRQRWPAMSESARAGYRVFLSQFDAGWSGKSDAISDDEKIELLQRAAGELGWRQATERVVCANPIESSNAGIPYPVIGEHLGPPADPSTAGTYTPPASYELDAHVDDPVAKS